MARFTKHTLTLALFLWASLVNAETLKSKLEALENVVSVTEMENNIFFEQAYVLAFRQPLDHKHPEKGSFNQRVILSHKGFNRPSVFVTEGYGAAYAIRTSYLNELPRILDANQVVCEHRYFLESMPKHPNYEYLTVENAAADHHEVLEALKTIYSTKWLTTGISKGGQTVMYHRMLYPNDADASVPYVGPLNFSNYDKRHSVFLSEKVGTAEDRAKIATYQHDVLKRREELVPLLKDFCIKKKFTFSIPIDHVLDYMVLEYPFALWQWGTSRSQIPELNASVDKIFDHLVTISSPSYFSEEGTKDIQSFFVQAQRELGYYAYDVKPFQGELVMKSADNYMTSIFIPDPKMQFKYSGKMSKKTQKYLDKKADHMILVYGEWDPWSATAVKTKNSNVKIYYHKEGSHRARIVTLPENDQKEIVSLLKSWLE